MTTSLLQALTERHGLPVVDETTLDALLRPAKGEADHVLLFFPGDVKLRPESTDIAIILPQILNAFSGRLRGGVVSAASEERLRPRFQVLISPCLVLTKGESPVDVFSKVLDWSEYISRIETALDDITVQ